MNLSDFNLEQWVTIAPGLTPTWEKIYGAIERSSDHVFPLVSRTFRALELVNPEHVKVVILGQDPYHTAGKASGLAFGYHPKYRGPTDSSLLNIITELGADPATFDRSLEPWANQGVLLLNTRLTVEEGKPLSHADQGWEEPVGQILSFLADRAEIVWLLWGNEARDAAKAAGVLMGAPNTIVTSHPCRYSHQAGKAPFTGSHCFLRANAQLLRMSLPPINWKGDGFVSWEQIPKRGEQDGD